MNPAWLAHTLLKVPIEKNALTELRSKNNPNHLEKHMPWHCLYTAPHQPAFKINLINLGLLMERHKQLRVTSTLQSDNSNSPKKC